MLHNLIPQSSHHDLKCIEDCVVCCRGSTAVAILGIYYVAPLSSLFQVLRERDSSTIYWPLCLTNLINAVLWTVYGMVSEEHTPDDHRIS